MTLLRTTVACLVGGRGTILTGVTRAGLTGKMPVVLMGEKAGLGAAVAKVAEDLAENSALCLAQQGTFSRTLTHGDAPRTRDRPAEENTGNPLEKTRTYADTEGLEVTGGLVALLVFKTSVGLKRSRVGSIPIHLR